MITSSSWSRLTTSSWLFAEVAFKFCNWEAKEMICYLDHEKLCPFLPLSIIYDRDFIVYYFLEILQNIGRSLGFEIL